MSADRTCPQCGARGEVWCVAAPDHECFLAMARPLVAERDRLVEALREAQSDEAIERAARALAPAAFSGSMLTLGCGGLWHYEGHSSHSSCPACGSRCWDQRSELERKQNDAQERARVSAQAALGAALEGKP